MTTLSIVILNYNTKDLTLQCIKSIQDNYKKQLESGEFEIIIVDNNSTDDSVFSIKKKVLSIENIKFLENKENVGFSRGNNIGAKEARGKYLLFLNSDTEVLDNGLLGMIDFLEKNERIGILGAKLKNIDGSNQPSCGKFYNLVNIALMLFGGGRLGLLRFSPKKIQNVDWVSGAALMIRSDLFKILCGFDEKLFMYMEDMELCYRVIEKKYIICFYPGLEILHKERGSSNKEFAIVNIYKGLIYFYKKHKNKLQYILLKILLILKAGIAIFIGLLTNNKNLTNTYKKALQFNK